MRSISSQCFNSRVREGRDPATATKAVNVFSFNSRVREGRDTLPQAAQTRERVSTHASARDATRRTRCRRLTIGFQLTRPRGTRPKSTKSSNLYSTFQLTRPRGTRQNRKMLYHIGTMFQLTRPRGTRQTRRCRHGLDFGFQLTRPRGTRRGRITLLASQRCFNSRVREGRDLSAPVAKNNPHRFNSRVREGRDGRRRPFAVAQTGFNSRVREGRDARSSRNAGRGAVSTHASARDATRYFDGATLDEMFQLTRPRGTRRFFGAQYER